MCGRPAPSRVGLYAGRRRLAHCLGLRTTRSSTWRGSSPSRRSLALLAANRADSRFAGRRSSTHVWFSRSRLHPHRDALSSAAFRCSRSGQRREHRERIPRSRRRSIPCGLVEGSDRWSCATRGAGSSPTDSSCSISSSRRYSARTCGRCVRSAPLWRARSGRRARVVRDRLRLTPTRDVTPKRWTHTAARSSAIPTSPTPTADLGALQQQHGDRAAARTCYEAAVAADGAHVEAGFDLAGILEEDGRDARRSSTTAPPRAAISSRTCASTWRCSTTASASAAAARPLAALPRAAAGRDFGGPRQEAARWGGCVVGAGPESDRMVGRSRFAGGYRGVSALAARVRR